MSDATKPADARPKESVLKFRLETGTDFRDLFDRFHPQGKTVLNRTEWMGKAPRTCGVTRVRSQTYSADHVGKVAVDVEVSYRPKGCITYVGGTRYDGWTAMLLDRAKDGTMLDGKGKPLPPGAKEVYLPFEMYEDVDFNEIDFGTYLGETPVERVRRVSSEDVDLALRAATRFNGSANSTFLAARRSRPSPQVLIIDEAGRYQPMAGPDRLVLVDRAHPHLTRVLLDHLTDFIGGFFEGRYSMLTLTTDAFTLLKFRDVLVDVTRSDGQQQSQFNVVNQYLTGDDLYELATRLMATYEVVIELVEGEKPGFLLRHPKPDNRFET